MNNRKPLLVLNLVFRALLLFSAVGLYAQVPVFKQVRTPDAIRDAITNCLYQDSTGNIWIGTGQGLYRYDGRSFTLIPSATGSEPIRVSAVFMDSKRNLWVGSKKGKVYLLKDDSLKPFLPEEGLPVKAITGFASDGRGNLWFSTYGEGLYYYNGRHLYSINSDDGLTDDFCYRIVADAYGRIWAATDEGISICYASEKMKKIEKITTLQGLPDNIVLTIVPGKNGHMWAGMQDGGVCSVNPNTLKASVPPVFRNWAWGPVKDILVYNDVLWISTEKSGILEVKPQSNIPPVNYTHGENFVFQRVNEMLSDNQGNCWISAGGDLIISPGPSFIRWKAVGTKKLGVVQSILNDQNGMIWYSTEGRLFRFIPDESNVRSPKEVFLPLKRHTHIISLYQDAQGFIWAGTFGEGLFRINPSNGSVRLFNGKDGLANGNILGITGKGNNIWLATLGGVFHANTLGKTPKGVPFRFESFHRENGPGDNYIYSVFIDSKHRVWFGTDGKGISMLKDGRLVSFGEKEGIRSRVVYSIAEDKLGNIWFSTSTAGVYKYDGKIFTNYTVADGLSTLHINSIAADDKYHVFFAHDHGIDILDSRSNSFIYYGAELNLDGMNPDLNVITGSGSSQLWLGTQEGMIRIEIPGSSKPVVPALQLNRVSIFLGNNNYLDKHEFTYNQNHISFYFNAIWVRLPDQVTYQIKLEGYDLDWLNTRDNMVTYSSLQPGEYTFRVRAALKDNFNNSAGLSYHFVIRKPYWKETGFILAVLFITILFVLMIIRLRELSLKREENLERERLISQLQTMRSQVNPHFLFNSFSTLMSVIDEDKEMAIEYVQKLSQFFRNILEYRDKDLIPLSEELKLIDTYSYLQKQRYGDNFRMEIYVDPDKLTTLIPPLAIQMIVENAIKHNIVSVQKPLLVELFTDSKYLIIKNNLQRKKLLEPSTGVGLLNIRSRYRLLGYENVVVQEINDEFIIKLPLIKP